MGWDSRRARLFAKLFPRRVTSNNILISLTRCKPLVMERLRAKWTLRICLTCLHQFPRLCDMRFGLVTLQHAIQKPNDETVHQQNERSYDSWMMPNVTYLEGNQGRCRKYHEQFRPALLHVNADSFGKKYRRVKKRQKTRGTQRPAGEHGLQFIQQIIHCLAVFQQDFVSGPVRQGIHPAGPRVEEKQRNTKQKQQDTFADFEERDQPEIAMATRFLQNRRLMRQFTHSSTVRRNFVISQ